MTRNPLRVCPRRLRGRRNGDWLRESSSGACPPSDARSALETGTGTSASLRSQSPFPGLRSTYGTDSNRLGLWDDATLKVAQGLYEGKLISYPRTGLRRLGNDMKAKVPEILGDLRTLKPSEIGKLDLLALAFTGRIVDDKKVNDHHTIIPTGKLSGSLSPGVQKVFDAVVTRLIAAFHSACVKEVTTVAGVPSRMPFRAKGVRVLEQGWTALYPRGKMDEAKDGEQELPALTGIDPG